MDLHQICYGRPTLLLYLEFSPTITLKPLSPEKSYCIFWYVVTKFRWAVYILLQGKRGPLFGTCTFLLKMCYCLSDYTASDSRRQWILFFSSALSSACRQLLMVYFFGLLFNHEDRGDILPRNVGMSLNYMSL
jgi:hypothetical protein